MRPEMAYVGIDVTKACLDIAVRPRGDSSPALGGPRMTWRGTIPRGTGEHPLAEKPSERVGGNGHHTVLAPAHQPVPELPA